MSTEPLLAFFARYISELNYRDLPESVRHRAKLLLMHNLLVALAARHQLIPGLSNEEEWFEGSRRVARRMRDGRAAPIDHAIFSNSMLMGARAQHDEHPASVSHFGSVVLPPLLAIAETGTLDGRGLLTALVAAYDVAGALGASTVRMIAQRGFRPTGVFGPLAAAAATAKARGADVGTTHSAMSIALSTSSGLTQVWLEGSDEWRFQTASAARNGYLAALHAVNGARGASRALEGNSGFLRAYAGLELDSVQREQIVKDIEQNWAVDSVLLKPYPVCALNQAAVQLALELRTRHRLLPAQISEIVVTLSPADAAYPGVDLGTQPESWAQAMMSVRFNLAVAMVHGDIEMTHLDSVDDAEVARMSRRVRLTSDDSIPMGHQAQISVELTNGTRLDSGEPRGITYDRDDALSLGLRLSTTSSISSSDVRLLDELVFSIDSPNGLQRLLETITALSARPAAG